MQLTKGAIGNLINRYKAVLKKCHLLNVFGSLAVAGMLVMGGTAAAGAVTVTTGQDFKNAVTDAEAGATITLGQDIEDGVGVKFENKTVSIDFAGHTYTAYAVSVGSTGTESQLFQLLKGSTVTLKNGTLDVASPTEESGKFKMVLQNYCDLTLENMVVDGSNLQGSAPYTMSNNHGDVVIKDSTIIAKEGGFAFDVYYWSESYEDGVSVTVADSTIDGRIEVTVDGNKAIGDNTHSLSISGGTLVGGLTAKDGGQLYTVGTTSISNVEINSNTATNSGGGIYNAVQKASDGNVAGRGLLTLNDVSFSGNSAAQGGAIYNAGTLTADAVSFSNNSATGKGGAIYNTGTMTVGGTFTDNTASQGGAISDYKAAKSTVSDGSIFKDNTATSVGGAISHVDSEKLTIGNNVLFEGNKSIAGQGGALHNQRSSTEIGDNVKFHNNIAEGFSGGAIYQDTSTGSSASLKIGTGAEFIGNQTETAAGGAIYNYNAGDGATITIDSGATFDSNKAGTRGGAISNWGGIVSVTDATFTNNSATNGGGAIHNDSYGKEGSSFTIDGSTFTGNSAAQGGAIYNNKGSVTIGNGTVFENNYSTGQNYGGGAIYSNGGSVTIEDNVQFTNNYLNQPISESTNGDYRSAGGAIAAWGSTELNIGKNVTFENNGYNAETGKAAWASGGAIYLDTNKTELAHMTIGEGTVFKGNVAGSLGGAIYAADSQTTISSALFDGNKAGSWGGAMFIGQYFNLGDDLVSLNSSTFTNNEAGNYGGALAIHNDASVAVNGSAFVGNKVLNENGLGGAIYNEGKLTFTGNNTFSGNMAAGQANDIHNAGSITVADGTTTLGSGLTQVGGNITVNGGTLDMASGSSLSFDEDSKLTIDGGTFVADFGQLLTDYATTNTANGITDESIIGTSGNLNLRLDGGYYTLEQYNAAKDALLGQADVPEDATLNFLNANLQLDDDQALVVGATPDDNGNVTIEMAPVVVEGDQAPEDAALAGQEIPSVPNQIVSVVEADAPDKELLSADTITVSDSEFTAKGLQIKEAEAVTLDVTAGSKVTLTGDEAGFTGVVNAEGDAVTTNVKVEGDAALTVGLEGNENAQNLVLNDVTVADGTFSVAGNGLDTTQVAANTLEVADASGTVIVDNASLTVENAVVENGLLSITDAVADLGTVKATGGVLFFDPSYGTIKSLANNELGSKLLVSDGSVVNVASGLDNLQELAQKAGFTTTADPATGGFILATGQSMLAVGQAIQLTPGGQIVVDAGVTYEETAPGSYVAKIDGNTIGDGAYFGQGSLLVVNGNTLNGATAAIDLSGATTKTLNVENGAKLLIADAVAGQKYTVISGATNADAATGNAFNGGTYNSDNSTGWKGDNLLTSSDMLTLTSTDGTVFMAKSEDAHTVFPGLSHELATAVNTLYGQKLNDVDADAMGVRFLSRATDNRFLGADKNAAASTIESAARIAFAGAVPQMTKMASDAGSNAVVNRLGFANPADGAQAMNAEGKIVDRNTTGFALWIAPLWQSQHGWGMEADNLDYGFNGNLGGVSLGADYTFENAIRAGITFNIGGGYAESSGGDLNSTENRMSFWGLGAYAGWNYENFGLMADVSYTSTWNDLQQDMDSRMGMGDLEADVQASAISAGLRAEYKLETSVLDVIPHIGVRYMSLNTWGFDAESNGGTVLEGDGFHQDIWTFPVGVTFTKDFTLDSGWSFKPSIDFSVIPAAGDIKAKQDVAFTGLPGTYEVETQMMDYLTWQGGVGLELGNDTMSFGVNYTLQAGQHTTGHGVFGSFRYEF